VKRHQLSIQDELDDGLATLARRERTTKAEIVRRLIAARLHQDALYEDPLDSIVGSVGDEPADDIDEVIYGR
jgi:hypothetical protein